MRSSPLVNLLGKYSHRNMQRPALLIS
jgi:hypothetical protein